MIIGTQDNKGRWPPWSRMPSLKEMAEEVEVDFDDLVQAIGENLSPQQLAARFEISQELAGDFKEHFYKYGISSVMGGD